jgi:FkbM family methyltransferase
LFYFVEIGDLLKLRITNFLKKIFSLVFWRGVLDTIQAKLKRGVPDIIQVTPGKFSGHFKYLTRSGKDLIATALWSHGWAGFEKPLPDIFAETVASFQDGLVLDVGANTGLYSLIATTVNRNLEAHAFEPFPPVEMILRANVDLNPDNHVKVFPQAVSDQMGTAKLYVPLQDHGVVETSCSLNSEFKEAHSEVLNVEQTTLDEHMKQYPGKKIVMIKIDVEGFEDHVLNGSRVTISTHRPIIVFEVLPNIDANKLEAIRRQFRYDSYRFRDDRLVPDDVIGYDPDSWNHIMFPSEVGVPAELKDFI